MRLVVVSGSSDVPAGALMLQYRLHSPADAQDNLISRPLSGRETYGRADFVRLPSRLRSTERLTLFNHWLCCKSPRTVGGTEKIIDSTSARSFPPLSLKLPSPHSARVSLQPSRAPKGDRADDEAEWHVDTRLSVRRPDLATELSETAAGNYVCPEDGQAFVSQPH